MLFSHTHTQRNERGFTLIELLVVIAIIGVLSSVVLASLNSARAKGRDAFRRASMKQLQVALEMYYDDNGGYPTTSGQWWGLSGNGGSRAVSGANAYIPGLTPQYISVLPADPSNNTAGWSGFLYRSNGREYKLLIHATAPESFPTAQQPFYDPVRPTWAWMVCSGPPACASW
jgi:type II secretion system protein G